MMTSSRADAPARKRPRDRRERILAAAAERFAQSGAGAAGMEDIAADVGITGGAIYRHFRSKDDLLAEVIRQAAARLGATAAAAAGPARVPGDLARLRRLIAATVELAVTNSAGLTLLIRDHSGPGAVSSIEEGLVETWARAVRVVGPGVDRARVGHRLETMLAALGEMSRSAGNAVLRRHSQLVTDAFSTFWTTAVSADPEPKPRPRAWRPAPSRADRILEAAMALFRQRGYDNVGMDDIAAAVGIAASGIYRFFPSKADILLDAYDLVVARVITEMERAAATADGPREALERLVESQVRAALDSVNLIFVTEWERHALPAGERPRLARRRRKIMEMHTALLLEARPELDTRRARLLLYGLQPLIRHAASSPRCPSNPAGEIAALARGLLLGSGKPGP